MNTFQIKQERKSKWISFEKAYVKNKFKVNFELVLVDRYNYFFLANLILIFPVSLLLACAFQVYSNFIIILLYILVTYC